MDVMTVAIPLFFVLLLAGIPIAFALGITATALFLVLDQAAFFTLVPQRMFAALNIFTIMAIPFFFMAAELMTVARITEDLIRFSEVVVGRIRGGLAHVNVLASALFAGMSGSAISDVAGLGAIEIRMMTAAGYDRRFATAITIASSLIGPMIPPSIIILLYGAIMQVSIAALFLGGFLPGILMAAMLMAMTALMARKYDMPRRSEGVTTREALTATRNALLALLMPAIILGGILSGIFTATEAAAVAVLYALLIGLFVKRTLKIRDIPGILARTAVLTSVVFMVLATSNILGWIIGLERVPERIADFLTALTDNPYLLLLLVNVCLLVVGMFMDIGAALIVMAPILAPTVIALGVHPVHFGIVMSLNLVLGLNTPPVGPCLFAATSVSGLRIEQISVALLPFYVVQLLFLGLITYFPPLTLTLPRLFGYIQ